MRCRWCHRPLGVKQSALALIGVLSMAHRTAEECLALEEREPVDRETWDWERQPPPDIDVCGACRGAGEVMVGVEWASHAPIVEPCTWCRPHPGRPFPWLVLSQS